VSESPEAIVSIPRRLVAPGILAIVVGALLGTTWRAEGMLAAQRIVIDLVMPVGLAWLTTLYVLLRSFVLGRTRACAVAGFIFLVISVSFSPIIARELAKRIEVRPLDVSPLDDAAPKFRAVVVLGGGASLGMDGRPQLNSDGHRVVMAAQMWYAGKTEAIICTGEDDFVPEAASKAADEKDKRDLHNPARLGVDVLVSLGVPRDRLFRIGGVNTYTEMKELAQFLKDPPADLPSAGALGLITSAFHIPRAIRLAERESLVLSPIPVSFRTGVPEPMKPADLVPTVGAGNQFYLVMREQLARLVGR
jgi:uncharacterized SAM-binding protein YcdF (DUF218 family)